MKEAEEQEEREREEKERQWELRRVESHSRVLDQIHLNQVQLTPLEDLVTYKEEEDEKEGEEVEEITPRSKSLSPSLFMKSAGLKTPTGVKQKWFRRIGEDLKKVGDTVKVGGGRRRGGIKER